VHNLNVTILPAREVALWSPPSNATFFSSELLRSLHGFEQPIRKIDVDDDVS
jgi:hypothetical protein